ncbi:MAG TPA: glycosyltransferase, partial [Tepidisphaeraceae bacterium]
IVVFSHLRWGFVWQRPQQFLSRFARHQPILFVEEPFFDLKSGAAPRLDLHAVMPNITVACPHCPPEMRTAGNLPAMLRQWVREAIDSINIRGEFDKPLLWYYSPMDSAWSLGHFENRGVVYDCMDELNQFTGAPKTLVDNERRLIENADVVFTGGYELWTKKKEQHENTHFYGCGVEFNHFNQAANPVTALPPDIDFMPRPILGWFGVVDERVDYHLLAEIARERPEWSIAVVGPVVKVDPNLLPHAPNLHWLGGRDYQQLPNYCAAFDVCMMAFAINKATEFINPTKALEYLATGKPVISTPVKDVVRQYADVVDIAKTPAEFIEAAERALTNPDKARIAAGLEMAKKASWESQVNQMRQNIKDALSIDNRRSKNVQPIADPPAGTMYKHTQGS